MEKSTTDPPPDGKSEKKENPDQKESDMKPSDEQENGPQPAEGEPDEKELDAKKTKGQKPKATPKRKKKAPNTPENIEIVEELYRDVTVRDETIKRLNLKVIDLQAQLKDSLIKAEKSGNAKRDYKIAHMQDDLRHAKNDLVLNSQQLEKFMEEGTKTVNEYIQKYEKAEEQLGKLREEITIKQNLLKNKDEIYRRVLADLQEARKQVGTLQVGKLQLEKTNNKLLQKIAGLKDEKVTLEDRLINQDSVTNKIKKQSMLVSEFNSKYYGINISEIGQEINKHMFELMVNLRKNHLCSLIQSGKDLRHLLEEEGREDLINKLKKFHDLKDFEPEETHKPVVDEKKPKKKKDKKSAKAIRKGGGYVLEKDYESDQESEKNKPLVVRKTKETMTEKEWKEYVCKVKLNNPVLKRLMNLSKHHFKGKDGIFKSHSDLAALLTKGVNYTKKQNNFLGKIFKVFKSKPTDETLIKENKELNERMDTYSKLLTMSISEIIKYVSEAKDGIEKIEDKYKGFFSLKDPSLLSQVTSKSETKEEMNPSVKLKHKEREIDELRDELNHIKIQMTDIESEYEKSTQKQLMYKSKLDLSKRDADDIKRDYQVRISDYKQALYEKDEETTKLLEAIKNLEREIRTNETVNSGSSYELESIKKKLKEAQHHQDMLTKKIREYEEVVRVINVNLKKNTSETTEASTTTKHKLREIEKMKLRFKILEDELHKREDYILALKSKLVKNSKELKHKDEEINKMITRRLDKAENIENTQKKEYESQIGVLKDMIVGLKSQIKAKDMDSYRLESKVVSLQSQIDAVKTHEQKLNSMIRSSHPSPAYSPASINSKLKVSTSRMKASRESARSKPLIKSTPKVQNQPKHTLFSNSNTNYESPLKQSPMHRKSSTIQSTKPNILISTKEKDSIEENSD
ncbi:unnamed protein product [Moneuplotes crassus]|uniref:Uncharacterized protein n=1 Tax=Euplotes crassus TaxID=5936 RepID=A0AAD1Y1N1_EUPCR|nr:unnamed protein product [Moneuplotes crassus]